MRYRSLDQIAFAIILSCVGIVLLLMNIGVISLEIKEVFVVSYPFFLFIYGIAVLIKLIKEKAGLLWPLSLILFSSLLILDRLHLFVFGFWDVWKLWPIFIIYLGISMMAKKRKINVHFREYSPKVISSDSKNDGETYFDQTINSSSFLKKDELEREVISNVEPLKRLRGFSLGDVKITKQNWAVGPMDFYNMIGDYFIDFSKGFIPEKEIPIKVKGWIGDVKMLIPEGVPVKVNAMVNVGDVRIFEEESHHLNHMVQFESEEYQNAIRKLHIIIKLKIGSIRIDRV